jgi:aminomethyltransferase
MAHAFRSANVYHLRTADGASSFTPLPETDVALRTPLYQAHLAAGARLVEFSGFDMPVQYQGVLEEHAAVREGVGIFDVSHMGEVTVEGPRALEAAQRLVTNDLNKCADGQAQYNALLNEKGGVIDDIIVYRYSPRRLFICVNASGRAKDFEWMKSRAGDGARVEQHSDDWAQLAIQGPKAAALVDSLCEPRVADLAYYHFREATVAGVRGCIVARTGYTGEDGFEVFCPPDGARKLWDAFVSRGAVPCGLGARDSLRLEVAYRLYGNDMDEEHTPLEAGLGWIVKLDKPGGFIGSEALVRQKKEGLKRKLAGFKLTGKGIARHGYPTLRQGKRVGEVTSGTMSPVLKEPIGLAYLPAELSKEGTPFDVEIRGKPVAAVVVKTPFVTKQAPKGA